MGEQTRSLGRGAGLPWQRVVLGLLAIAFVWLLVSHFTEVKKLATTLEQGQWIAAAAVLQAVYYLIFAATYQTAFYALGIKRKLLELVPVTLGALFVNVVTPTTSVAEAGLFVDDAARYDHTPARAATATLLQLVADYTAFLLVLLAGMAVLFRYHDLQTYEAVGALVLLLLTVALMAVLLVGIWRPQLVERLLRWVQALVNRIGGWFKNPALLDPGKRPATETEPEPNRKNADPPRPPSVVFPVIHFVLPLPGQLDILKSRFS